MLSPTCAHVLSVGVHWATRLESVCHIRRMRVNLFGRCCPVRRWLSGRMQGASTHTQMHTFRAVLGAVAEWLKAPPWKGGRLATVSRVRITPAPFMLSSAFFEQATPRTLARGDQRWFLPGGSRGRGPGTLPAPPIASAVTKTKSRDGLSFQDRYDRARVGPKIRTRDTGRSQRTTAGAGGASIRADRLAAFRGRGSS